MLDRQFYRRSLHHQASGFGHGHAHTAGAVDCSHRVAHNHVCKGLLVLVDGQHRDTGRLGRRIPDGDAQLFAPRSVKRHQLSVLADLDLFIR